MFKKIIFLYLISFIWLFSFSSNILISKAVANAGDFCLRPNVNTDDGGVDNGVIPIGKWFHSKRGGGAYTGPFNTQQECLKSLKKLTCTASIKEFKRCSVSSIWQNEFRTSQDFCLGYQLLVDVPAGGNTTDTVIRVSADELKNNNTSAWAGYFYSIIGQDWDNDEKWSSNKSKISGVYKCDRNGDLVPPASTPPAQVCGLQSYDVFSGGLGSSTCSGWEKCKAEGRIVPGGPNGKHADKNFFCINDNIVMCSMSIDSYDKAMDSANSNQCAKFNPITPDQVDQNDPNSLFVTGKPFDPTPLNPVNIMVSITNFLYYFAIFYFIVLILVNSISYVRAGEDPKELLKIKESLFNTIAGFLFVLLSGSVIIYLITQVG